MPTPTNKASEGSAVCSVRSGSAVSGAEQGFDAEGVELVVLDVGRRTPPRWWRRYRVIELSSGQRASLRA
ncbi:MAG: hypothetical protein WCF33_24135 [Pseudonocardiaceae bacterium]